MKFFASTISVVFQPLLLPFYAFLLYNLVEHQTTAVLRHPGNVEVFYRFSLALCVLTIIIPLISMIVMKRSGIITSLQIPNRTERIPVMFLVLIYYIITYYLFRQGNDMAHQIFGSFMSFLTGGLILSFLSIVITFKWKISLHAIGISGIAGAFLGMTEFLFPISNYDEMRIFNTALIAVTGIVGFSRMVLKCHDVSQVIAGILLGGVIEYVVVSHGYYF